MTNDKYVSFLIAFPFVNIQHLAYHEMIKQKGKVCKIYNGSLRKTPLNYKMNVFLRIEEAFVVIPKQVLLER